MAQSAYLSNTNAIKQPVHQVAHGFLRGDVLIWDGSAYIESEASSIFDSQGTVMVSDLNGPDDFWICYSGSVGPLDTGPYVSGVLYYVSPTSPGTLTSTRPTVPGQVILPCFLATATDAGNFFGGTGQLVESDAETTLVITASQALLSGIRFFVNGGAPLALTLPALPTLGDTIYINTINANGYVLTLNAGETIITSMGTFAVSATSTTIGDVLKLVCRTGGAGADWYCEQLNTPTIAFA